MDNKSIRRISFSLSAAAALACAAILVFGSIASGSFLTAKAAFAAASQDQNSSTSSSITTSAASPSGTAGNYIINYIYEIDSGKNIPRLALNPGTVTPGSNFDMNATNFKSNSTAKVDIFASQSMSLQRSNGSQTGSAALLMSGSNITLTHSSAPVVQSAPSDRAQTGNGTVYIVTKVMPTDLAAGNYDVGLACAAGDNQTGFNMTAFNPLVAGSSSAKQFFKLQLPAGHYTDCSIQILTAAGSAALESHISAFDVVPDSTSSGVSLATDLHGAFLKQVHVANNAIAGQYVLLAQTNATGSDKPLRAIAPLTIVTTSGGTSQSTSSSMFSSSSSFSSTSQTTTGETSQQVVSSGNQSQSNQTGGTPQPQQQCTTSSSSFSNVKNTEKMVSSQTSSNNATNNAVITVVQKISGTPSGNGSNISNNVIVNNVNTVTQSISQSVKQNANIENCGWSGSNAGGSSSSTSLNNSILMNATQNASNIFADDAIIIIEQTIIIPKSCDTSINSPVTVNNNNNVNQQVTQSINQNANIYYGNSGAGGSVGSGGTATTSSQNSVTQVSIQISNNTSVNKPIYTVNQVIIVPQSCPATISAPVVVNNVNNISENISQVTDQNASIYAGVSPPSGGVTILSSVGGSPSQSSLNNTITTIAIQNATNSFSNSPQVTIEQNVYYVGNTTGWDQSNYKSKLANDTKTGSAQAQQPAANVTAKAAVVNASIAQPGVASQNSTTTNQIPQGGGSNSSAISPTPVQNQTATQSGPPLGPGAPANNSSSTASVNDTSSQPLDPKVIPPDSGGPNKPQGN